MIKLNNVSKTIKKRTILEDLSITFEKGTVYLIEGHNGCGKTMLLRLLAGFVITSYSIHYTKLYEV